MITAKELRPLSMMLTAEERAGIERLSDLLQRHKDKHSFTMFRGELELLDATIATLARSLLTASYGMVQDIQEAKQKLK